MTALIHPRNDTRRRFLIGMASVFALSGLINDTQGDEQTMTTPKMTLWQAIEATVQQIPFSREKLEGLFSSQLTETDNTGNDVFLFYESRSVELKDGVVISNIDLRIKRSGHHPGFLVLNAGGTCVTLAEVRRHYGDIQMTGSPRGRSLNDATTYSSMASWGKLSFGFAERNPDCLAWIAFDPKKAD